MLPNNNGENFDDLIRDIEESEEEQTKTFNVYELDKPVVMASTNATVTHAVGGRIDELAALKQNIYFVLNIEADQYIIYPYTYGFNTLDLIGKPSYYVMAVIPERIKETLLSDNRVVDVTDFEFEVNKNKIAVKFIVRSIYGDIEEETAVMY